MIRHDGTLLAFALHRGEHWWRDIVRHSGFSSNRVISDRRGHGDADFAGDFYRALRQGGTGKLDTATVEDVVARDRVLRWFRPRHAARMVQASAAALTVMLDREEPNAIVTWPIDCYHTDILFRLAEERGIAAFELTVSAVPGMSMLMHRGQLWLDPAPADPARLSAAITEIADPLFVPTYVPTDTRYTRRLWLKRFAYYRLRAAALQLDAIVRRDPLNIHSLDAWPWLGHKPRLSDLDIAGLIDRDWRERVAAAPPGRRLFVALQLLPEASIDYWLPQRELIDHDRVLLAAVEAFSAAGFTPLVKDHPVQFGFRRTDFIKRLRAIPNVVILPYEVGGGEALAMSDVAFTETGTLGMQAALTGKVAVTAPTYYVTPGDFVTFGSLDEIAGLPARVAATAPSTHLPDRQRRIVGQILRGSFEGDFLTVLGYDRKNPPASMAELGRNLGSAVARHTGRGPLPIAR